MKQKLEDINYFYKINNTIKERSLLQPNQRTLIAISGGQDSICILQIFSHLKLQWNWKLGIVHCDHRWSNNSKLQTKHIARLAIGMQVDFYQPVTVKAITKETLARNWRYETIKTIAREHNYAIVLTAHSASDRIETLFYHLMRGTGLEGIQSINWKREWNYCRYLIWKNKISKSKIFFNKVFFYKIDFLIKEAKSILRLQLVRPLLGSTRLEIRKLLYLWKLPSWPDSTNQIITIYRNRIRHQLIPHIRSNYNPKFDEALARWAEITYSENAHLNKLTYTILEKIQVKMKNFEYQIYTNGINIGVLHSCPIFFQRRILKLFIYKHIKRTLSFCYIEHIRLFIFYKKNSQFFIHPKKHTQEPLWKFPYIYLPKKGKLVVVNNTLVYLDLY